MRMHRLLSKYHIVGNHMPWLIKILQKLVARKAEKKISRALGLGDQGSVSLNVQTDRGGYCPGEKIAITREFRDVLAY